MSSYQANVFSINCIRRSTDVRNQTPIYPESDFKSWMKSLLIQTGDGEEDVTWCTYSRTICNAWSGRPGPNDASASIQQVRQCSSAARTMNRKRQGRVLERRRLSIRTKNGPQRLVVSIDVTDLSGKIHRENRAAWKCLEGFRGESGVRRDLWFYGISLEFYGIFRHCIKDHCIKCLLSYIAVKIYKMDWRIWFKQMSTVKWGIV